MEIQYQRNLKSSYMVITESERPMNPDGELAERMLKNRKIAGLLTWSSMENERCMSFWYQITGYRSLMDHMQQQMIDHRLLQLLFAALLQLQEELPRFYLKPKHLLLQPEQIFLDAEGAQISMCYEPMWEAEPRESLQKLMEQLLPHIDHSDKPAVALAYGIYEICQQPNADIWQYVWEQACLQEENTAEHEMSDSTDMPRERITDAAVLSVSAGSAVEQRPPEEENTAVSSGNFLNRYISQLSEQADGIKKLGKDFLGKGGLRKKQEKISPTETVYMFEPEEESVASEHPTVFLGAGSEPEGRLCYHGGSGQQSFQIGGDSFLIGGTHGQADGIIEGSGISRNHARITKEGHTYFIEDLNSKNGTYLNDELLLYRQKRVLKVGDRLRFATEEYTFY